MSVRVIPGAALLLALAACSPDSAGTAEARQEGPIPGATAAAAEGAPEAPPPVPVPPVDAPLGQWLVGAWSYDTECATDFAVHFNADGSVQNAGDIGTWRVEGDRVTERTTERFEMGDDAPQKLDPPEQRSYRVEKIDATHGVITIEGRKVPIQRC